MGVYNTELFNNLGLCCFYSQQFDHTISCFERAINLASEETIADVWYNISLVAIVCKLMFTFNYFLFNLMYVEINFFRFLILTISQLAIWKWPTRV